MEDSFDKGWTIIERIQTAQLLTNLCHVGGKVPASVCFKEYITPCHKQLL